MNPYKIYSDTIDGAALSQFYDAMKLPCVIQGALMPDAHKGYTLPIGAVVATDNMVFPSWVGYDIGCGMCAVKISTSLAGILEKREEIFEEIYKAIPVGFNSNDSSYDFKPIALATETARKIYVKKQGGRQLGSLGGGNHFIEIGQSAAKSDIWIIIHSGSRGFGHGVAQHYMCLASPTGKASEGHYGFEADSANGEDYIRDLGVALQYALANRKRMIHKVVTVLQDIFGDCRADWGNLINRNHNHAELKDGMWIHRKGATHAEEGMMGVIPGNMRDGSFIVRGKGVPEALWSSSHGAGRVLGRRKAKETLDLSVFEDQMKGITARVTHKTLDESPGAYKDIFQVIHEQQDLVHVVAHVSPIINIKG